MPLTVHDYYLRKYEVNHRKGTIVLYLENPHSEPIDYVRAIFRESIAYNFIHDTFKLGTILFSIVEADPNEIYTENESEFLKDLPYGWPGEWASSAEAARDFFEEEGVKGYYITPSLGLSGWVLAQSFELEPGEEAC